MLLSANLLVSTQKWPFSAIWASARGVACATYYPYVSAQPLDFSRSEDGIFDLVLRKLLIPELETDASGPQYQNPFMDGHLRAKKACPAKKRAMRSTFDEMGKVQILKMAEYARWRFGEFWE